MKESSSKGFCMVTTHQQPQIELESVISRAIIYGWPEIHNRSSHQVGEYNLLFFLSKSSPNVRVDRVHVNTYVHGNQLLHLFGLFYKLGILNINC